MKTQKKVRQNWLRYGILLVMLWILTFFCSTKIYAAPIDSKANVDTVEGGATSGEVQDPDSPEDFELNITSNAGSSSLSASMKMILVLTVLSLAPFILIMVTSFTRIIVVLHFLRSALGTQTTPPNQVLIGLALFLTLFIMTPVMSQVNTDCIQPFEKGELTQEQALEAGMKPIRTFMFEQTNRKDIKLFLDIENKGETVDITDESQISTAVLIPAFMISELRTAFIIGFLIYLPFIVIDMVVASTLMSMGMMMLPPTTISMPFKILLFVLADGWNLVIGQVVKTFY
ncbi:MAG: flagellar type III secretion system pore protein FliP [Eubacterium sp.]|nr:flagellar type III secretion system pore protein FliP [Eubacterium sp.]